LAPTGKVLLVHASVGVIFLARALRLPRGTIPRAFYDLHGIGVDWVEKPAKRAPNNFNKNVFVPESLPSNQTILISCHGLRMPLDIVQNKVIVAEHGN
jgi:hypothetical protein